MAHAVLLGLSPQQRLVGLVDGHVLVRAHLAELGVHGVQMAAEALVAVGVEVLPGEAVRAVALAVPGLHGEGGARLARGAVALVVREAQAVRRQQHAGVARDRRVVLARVEGARHAMRREMRRKRLVAVVVRHLRRAAHGAEVVAGVDLERAVRACEAGVGEALGARMARALAHVGAAAAGRGAGVADGRVRAAEQAQLGARGVREGPRLARLALAVGDAVLEGAQGTRQAGLVGADGLGVGVVACSAVAVAGVAAGSRRVRAGWGARLALGAPRELLEVVGVAGPAGVGVADSGHERLHRAGGAGSAGVHDRVAAQQAVAAEELGRQACSVGAVQRGAPAVVLGRAREEAHGVGAAGHAGAVGLEAVGRTRHARVVAALAGARVSHVADAGRGRGGARCVGRAGVRPARDTETAVEDGERRRLVAWRAGHQARESSGARRKGHEVRVRPAQRTPVVLEHELLVAEAVFGSGYRGAGGRGTELAVRGVAGDGADRARRACSPGSGLTAPGRHGRQSMVLSGVYPGRHTHLECPALGMRVGEQNSVTSPSPQRSLTQGRQVSSRPSERHWKPPWQRHCALNSEATCSVYP